MLDIYIFIRVLYNSILKERRKKTPDSTKNKAFFLTHCLTDKGKNECDLHHYTKRYYVSKRTPVRL